MSKTLDSIKKPIEKELVLFEKHFKNAMKSDVALLDRITYYIVKRKGKQIRPMFVFLCAKIFGEVNEASYIAASQIELLHTATLVHDDVVDDADKRRGFFSINALWKNKIAVLVGDFLFSRGMLIAVDSEEFQIFKVATLISSACSTGAFSTSRSKETLDMMWDFGIQLGIAYQLKDDIFDYGGLDIGKPLGIDIKEKKMTLPLIHVLDKSDRKIQRWIKKILSKHNNDKNKVQELIKFVKENGGIEYAQEKMIEHRDNALKILEKVPESKSKTALIKLVHFIVERKK